MRRIAALVTLFNILSAAAAQGDRDGPAPWDEDRAGALFGASAEADTIGLAPVWSLVVRDSGRWAEVITNRFRDPAFGMRFPTDSVWLRRFRAY